MIKKKRFMAIMTTFLAVLMLASVSFAYAANEKTAKKETSKEKSKKTEEKAPVEPLREIHKVKVDEKKYCFFVTNNVVITPKEIADMTDEELTEWILKCAGLYMKESNCRLESHKAITIKEWTKSGGRLLLYDEDIASMRAAAPEDGNPYKLYMDLQVSDKPAPKATKTTKTAKTTETTEPAEDPDAAVDPDEQDQDDQDEQDVLYSTYKKVSPSLLFVVIATETDAAKPEAICKAPARKPEKQKEEKMPKEPKEPKELLPEQRTIPMVDRSGGPIEDTLKDGKPVKLEWIEPSNHPTPSGSFKPGSSIGLAVIVAALAALLVLIIRKLKKRNED